MATEKNITMKQFNGTDYDTLYPKTLASQIPDVYSKSQTYPQSQLYTRSQLYTQSQIDSMINSINTALDGKVRIQTGSYVGTDTYGASNPCSLTFDFVPKYLWVSKASTSGIWSYAVSNNIGLHYMSGITSCSAYYSGKYNEVNISVSGKTISWYLINDINTQQAACQFNEAGTTYFYVAFG